MAYSASAFTGNIRQPRQYTNNQNTNKFQNTFDRLITVTDYNLDKGYLYGTDEKGRNYEVYVNPEEVSRANLSIKERGVNTTAFTYLGHSIDEKMKKNMPPNSKVVLIRSKIISNDKTRNVSVTEVHRINSVPSPEADKAFQGIFTLTARPSDQEVRLAHVQHWNPNGVDLNDEDALQALKESIDAARADYGTMIGEFKVTKPTIGIQFRTLLKTDRQYEYGEEGKKDIFEVVDTSVPFDWIPGPLDEEGKEIKTEAHPITGDEMLELAEMYVEHINSNENFEDKLDDMRVEVCYYHVYPASNNDNNRLLKGDPESDKHADKNPLYQLSHGESYVDMANSEKILGKNAAVTGIIQISSNRLEKINGKPEEIPVYWVSRVYANNVRGHVHAFIRTSDGYKTEPHEALKLIRKNRPENVESVNSQPERQEQVATSRPVQQVQTPTPVQEKKVEEDSFDPFASSGDDPFAAPVNEEPAPEAAPAETPAKAPRFALRSGTKS